MKVYRVQFFDRQGRPARSHEMLCQNDDDAIERTARLRHRHTIELWRPDRLVWRFEPHVPRQARRAGAA